MSNRSVTENPTRYSLGALLLLIALNAFAGGYYGMAGAKNVPLEWLNGSPFHNYFIPSLILFIGVGGSALIAAIAILKKHWLAHKAAFLCGVIVLAWITGQISIIGYVSWLQPTIAIAGFLIIFLTALISKRSIAL